MNWFTFSILSIFALALAELTQQKILNTSSNLNERFSAVLTFLAQSMFTIPLILFFGLQGEILKVFAPDTLPYFLVVSITGSIGMIFYLRSFKVQNISISTIFVSLSMVVSTILGIIFLNESLYFLKILGLLLILSAIISLNIKNLQLEKNHFYGLLAGLIFGLTYTLDKKVVLDIHPIVYMFWIFLTVAFYGLIFNIRQFIDSAKLAKISDYKSILVSACGYFIYNFSTFTAYTIGGEVGRVDAINNSQVFLIILVEYYIFKQTEGFARKIATAVLAFSGVLILGYL